MKILLDTDIGSDIDDAVCLAYLLMQPECDLLGITTVSGESEQRARLASAICMAAGRDIVIVPGVENPLLVRPRQVHAQQAEKLENWPHRNNFPSQNPISFLAETILRHPGEVSLLTIGPLTNIALLFKVYPEVIPVLKELVMMCGAFFTSQAIPHQAEWNALLDPHAAAIVYQADLEMVRSIGLDVTRKVKLTGDQVREKFTHPVLQPVRDFASVWFKEQDCLTFHDPLAAVCLFAPDICEFIKGMVSVNTHLNEEPLGLTTFRQSAAHPKHQVAVHVAADRFFEEFFKVFGQ